MDRCLRTWQNGDGETVRCELPANHESLNHQSGQCFLAAAPLEAILTAHHCPLCGTFHDELRNCPDLVPGYADSRDGRMDAADQRRWDEHTMHAIELILAADGEYKGRHRHG